jgi:hypothetical protein
MSHNDWNYKSGQWNTICQSCGRKFKSGHLKKRWDGLWVCREDFELRHPQDFLRPRKDTITPPWTSPEPADTFVTVNYVVDYVIQDYILNQNDYVEDLV